MTVPGKRQALGRGLNALIPSAPTNTSVSTDGGQPRGDALLRVAIEDVHPAAKQPRKTFEEGPLRDLADSIRAQGIIQPLVVRRRAGGGYELIAGERRWRAAQRAGLHDVPVVVRDVEEARAFEMALVENLQRADLNPIEEAEGYARLVDEFDYTQEALAERVGKERSTVANALRLLHLPLRVREMVVSGTLQMGHARALLGLQSPVDMERLARTAVAKDLSVRKVEALVRQERDTDSNDDDGAAKGDSGTSTTTPSANARDLGERLQRALGLRARVIESGPGRGRVELNYGSLDDLDRLLARLID